MDVSNSMAATDVKPSRIGAAEIAAKDFVNQQPSSVRIGVVAFGEGAVIVQPPTPDHSDVLSALKSLSLGGGTSLGAGILTSLDAVAGKTIRVNPAELANDASGQVNIGYYGGSTIVVMSDGEDTSQTNPLTGRVWRPWPESAYRPSASGPRGGRPCASTGSRWPRRSTPRR